MSRQKLVQKQYQALSPQQIQFLGLLQIPITSLEKKIEDELEENPLLEEDEVEEHEGDSRLTKFESHKRKNYEDVQIEESSNSLENHLQKQLVDLNVNERERYLINYLINSLDKSGFLNRDLYSICGDIMLAEDFEATENELEKALKKLQSLEPTGVGAKDLKECLIDYRSISKEPCLSFKGIDEGYFNNLSKVFPNQNVYKLWLVITQDVNFGNVKRNDFNHTKDIDTKSSSELKRLQQKETIKRYQFINSVLKLSYNVNKEKATDLGSKLDRILIHRFWGYAIFFAILLGIFQAIFDWSSIPMDFIDESFSKISSLIKDTLPAGLFTDLLSEGIIPGIGGIVIFIPQIAFLFLFISIFEETGYMSRIVFLMDRTMRRFGLSGKSIVPLASGAACAIPAIMATRNIENWKQRLITILVVPFVTCSARLPVYLIMISLVIPDDRIFGINVQGLTLMGLYLIGFGAALLSAFILSMTLKIYSKSFFVVEMPNYKVPLIRNVVFTIFEKTKTFVVEAGKVILAISIILWALASFGYGEKFSNPEKFIVEKEYKNVDDFEKEILSFKLENSFLGKIGKAIEPVIQPIGYDWKIGIAVLSSFAAREVFVGTLSTIYSVDGDSEETIKSRMLNEKDENGNPVFNLASGISLMLFYAFALQCMSTIAIVKKETNSWK